MPIPFSAAFAELAMAMLRQGFTERAVLTALHTAGVRGVGPATMRTLAFITGAERQVHDVLRGVRRDIPVPFRAIIWVPTDEFGRAYGLRHQFVYEFVMIQQHRETGELRTVFRRFGSEERLSIDAATAEAIVRVTDVRRGTDREWKILSALPTRVFGKMHIFTRGEA